MIRLHVGQRIHPFDVKRHFLFFLLVSFKKVYPLFFREGGY